MADLAFRTAAVHDAGEADDGSRAAGVKPTEAVHDESQIRRRFGCQHAGRGEARVVDEQGVGVARPFDGVGRVGDDGFERLKIRVLWVEQGVAQGNVELVVADIMQEHVDAAEVIGGQVDLLPIKALADVVLAQDLGKVQQQRAGPAGGVVDLVDLAFADQGQAGEQLGDVLGGEELAAAFAGVGGVHGHQVFVGVAKGVDVIILVAAEGHLADAVHEGDQAFVAFHDGVAELVTVEVDVVEEPFEVLFAFSALGGGFDVAEDAGEGHVEIGVVGGLSTHVLEEFAGEDEETLGLDQTLAGGLGDFVGEFGVVEVGVASLALATVDELGEVLGDVAVEEHAEDVLFEVPAVDGAAQVVGDVPDGAVEFGALGVVVFGVCQDGPPWE